MNINFNFQVQFRILVADLYKMPQVNVQPAPLEQEIIEILQELKEEKSWTRKRLVRMPDGTWVRIGRLRRVKYID